MNVKTLLYESESLREAFGVIAHQWRQPLSHINALVSSMDNRLYELGVNDSVISKQLLDIEMITKEMSKSIDSYRGYFYKKEDKIKVTEFFENIQKSVEHTLKDKNINFNIKTDDTLELSLDETLLQEIIVTIINNSRDALVSRNTYEPFVNLSAWSEGGCLFIKLCDNAGGMSKSIMQKIFEPDFTTKHTSEGTGVGLFMVKKILDEKLNAQIDVKNVESGVCFTLKIPRNKDGK